MASEGTWTYLQNRGTPLTKVLFVGGGKQGDLLVGEMMERVDGVQSARVSCGVLLADLERSDVGKGARSGEPRERLHCCRVEVAMAERVAVK